MKLLSFNKVISDATSKFRKIKKSNYQTESAYKIVDQGKELVAGYTDKKELVNFDLVPIIIFGDHTRIFKYVSFPIALGADGAKALKCDSSIAWPKYVYFYFKSLELKDAGYSRHFKFLKEKKIPIPYDGVKPSIDDQIRIAHLLGKVEGLIARRKQHLQQLDELLKSVFLEMFGDPVRNEKGWNCDSMANISDSRLGKMRDKKFITGKHLRQYIGNSNVQWFRFVFEDLLEMDFDERERKIFKLEYGDFLVCEGGEIGRCAIWKNEIDDCYFQKALHRVRFDTKIVIPEYVAYVFLLYSLFNGFKNVTSKATIAHLTGEKLKETKIPIPPISLQNQFAAIVEKVEGIKIRYQKSLTELENLYGALSQKAFKGELDLSRVPLTKEYHKTHEKMAGAAL